MKKASSSTGSDHERESSRFEAQRVKVGRFDRTLILLGFTELYQRKKDVVYKKGLATWVYRFVWRYTKSLKASPGCQENNKTRLHCNLYCHKLSCRDLRYPNCKYSRNTCQKTRDRKTCSCSLDMLCNQSHGRLQYNYQQPWVLSSRYRSKIVSKPANNWPHAVITSLMWSVESPSSQFWLLFMRCCSSCVITSHCGWHKDQSPAVGLWRE